MERSFVWLSLASFACSEIAGVEDKELAEREDAAAARGARDAAAPAFAEDASSAGPSELGDRPGRPPSRPTAHPDDGRPEGWLVFAARRVYLGISDRETGERDTTGWRRLGFDLDGLTTTADDLAAGTSGTCLSAGAPNLVADGDDGRDNAVGASFFQAIGDADPMAETSTNEGLERGANTLIIVLEGVRDHENDASVFATLYISTSEEHGGTAPKWDGTDVRGVSTLSFLPGTATPMTTFPNGYISNGVWVSGDQETTSIDFWFPLHPRQIQTVPARIIGRGGWLTIDLNDGEGGPGMMGFSTSPGEFAQAFTENVRAALQCAAGSSVNAILDAVARNVDVRNLAPWDPDPASECDGLSWALGFEWAPVAHPDIDNPVSEPTTPPCP